ncbi:large ribosomal subunit protein bL33m [Physeter macrocephalus]|uniref:Large ribosomal subunit protein bL33m n=1 Tax=Physeter macrocephalus TaxID=9755 RepID=A0A9W2X091_PHYMC|nr:39S ribosomal protein L33, mitochondrial [Physeter catodon]
MFLSAVTCKWGWRRQQDLQRGREVLTGGPRDVAGWGASAGREAAAATSQAFRTTAPGMPRAALTAGLVGLGGLRRWFWMSCGSFGLESQSARSGALSPALCSVAKTKSKTILVKMLSQAGTGFSFNTKRSRLREKLTLLHYDP